MTYVKSLNGWFQIKVLLYNINITTMWSIALCYNRETFWETCTLILIKMKIKIGKILISSNVFSVALTL